MSGQPQRSGPAALRCLLISEPCPTETLDKMFMLLENSKAAAAREGWCLDVGFRLSMGLHAASCETDIFVEYGKVTWGFFRSLGPFGL